MRVCPKCGYVDPPCWRDPFSRGMEVDYTKIAELEREQPEIAAALKQAPLREKNPVREVVVGAYAYGLWDSGYVRRRWVVIWKVQAWKAIPMEKPPHKRGGS